MSLADQRRRRADAEAALQQALGACQRSADGALEPLRRHWPAMLLGGSALLGWALGRRGPAPSALAPGALLGQALGLLPLLLRWNAMLVATREAEAAAHAAEEAAEQASADHGVAAGVQGDAAAGAGVAVDATGPLAEPRA